MQTLRDFHEAWAYVAVAANGLVGLAGLLAWRRIAVRGRWLWWVTGVAEVTMLVQVASGVVLTSSDDHHAPQVHLFYGILAFVVVGFAYAYRAQMRGRLELLYGLVGLFLMGLGIRAMLEVT